MQRVLFVEVLRDPSQDSCCPSRQRRYQIHSNRPTLWVILVWIKVVAATEILPFTSTVFWCRQKCQETNISKQVRAKLSARLNTTWGKWNNPFFFAIWINCPFKLYFALVEHFSSFFERAHLHRSSSAVSLSHEQPQARHSLPAFRILPSC